MSMLASRVSCPRVAPSRRSRSATVVVKAITLQEASDWLAKGFVKIFSPPETNVKDWPTNNFSGRISHHEAPRKPFKDGYQSSTPLPPSSSMEYEEKRTAGYVEDAVRGVVAGLPSTTDTEPTWTGATSWKGEIHQSGNKRDARDGFHAKKN